MRRLAGQIARAALKPFGKTLTDIPSGRAVPGYVWQLIISTQPDVVLDVGANEGQFAKAIRAHGYEGHVISFEPQPTVFSTLSRLAADDPKWRCHQLAVGDAPGEADMHISAYSQSSSLLPIGKLHTNVMPNTTNIGTVRVPVVRLDEWAKSDSLTGRLFLKLDVQGYELAVLRGATELLNTVHGVLAELNFAPLFDGQSKYYDVMRLLDDSGFRLVDLFDINFHPETNDYLWADGLFLRR